MADALRDFVSPGIQPEDRCAESLADFLGTNPVSAGLEGKAVGIGIGIEAGHGMLL